MVLNLFTAAPPFVEKTITKLLLQTSIVTPITVEFSLTQNYI